MSLHYTDWKDLLGKTRDEVISLLGEPDDKGGTSKKYKTPSIYKYEDIEVFFEPCKNGICCSVFDGVLHRTITKQGEK